MNRTVNGGDSLAGDSLHRRGNSFTGITRLAVGDTLDLTSVNRRSFPLPVSDESDVSLKIGRISAVSTKANAHGGDDLLSFVDGPKHDYDWLLTPPGTPKLPPDRNEPQQQFRRSNSLSKSTSSTIKSSRLSDGQAESIISVRSSSVTRPSSATSTQSNPFLSSRPSPVLNTSSVSLSSYLRPSASVSHPPSLSRPSNTLSRPTSVRPSTPSKYRPLPGSSERARTSTPTSRPLRQPSPSSPVTRSNPRPSTPSSRTRVTSNGCNHAPSHSRSSSPGPKPRSPRVQVPPDFPTDTPPNLRTTLSDRPLSVGRSRPGASSTTVNGGPRRQPSPGVTRGRSVEPALGKSRGIGNGQLTEGRRVPGVSESGGRKALSTTTVPANSSSTSFGRNISKKSIDMAVRHMDIRTVASGSIRQISGTLFPQSIRPAPTSALSRRARLPDTDPGGPNPADNRDGGPRLSTSLRESGSVFESSRYDSILLREDSKNMSWLHNADDRSDLAVAFDSGGFELLPEPFGPV